MITNVFRLVALSAHSNANKFEKSSQNDVTHIALC